MKSSYKKVRLVNMSDEELIFFIYGKNVIPFNKFLLACKWYTGSLLTPKSKTLMKKTLDELRVHTCVE